MGQPVVLIVEDNQLARTMLRDALKGLACEVREAVDGDEALAALEQGPVAVLLLDLVLPRRSGSDVLRKVKERGLHTKVLVITSMDSRSMADQSLDDGAFGFIAKPYHPLELRSAVEGALAAYGAKA